MSLPLAGVPASLLVRWPLLAPLAHRNFALLWLGRVVSLAGDQFQLVALAAVALNLTQSAAGLGTLLMVQAVPRALLMLFGGVATDRFRPRTVMLASDAAQGVAVLGLALLAATGRLALWHLYVYAAVSGTVYAFFLPASNSIVPDVVPREQVRSANALNNTAFNLTFFLVPPLAGGLVAAFGVAPAFTINAVSFLGSVGALWLIRTGAAAPGAAAAGGLLRQLGAGFRAAREDEAVWLTLVMATVFMLGFNGAMMVGLPALAKLTLDSGDVGVGVLYGARGAGALVGGLVTGSLAGLRRPGLVGSLCILGAGIPMAIGAQATTLWAVVPLFAVSGAFGGACGVIFFTLVQTRAPAESRGAVMGLLSLALFGLSPLSLALAGLLGDVLGPPGVIALGGAVTTASGILGLSRRAMRHAT